MPVRHFYLKQPGKCRRVSPGFNGPFSKLFSKMPVIKKSAYFCQLLRHSSDFVAMRVFCSFFFIFIMLAFVIVPLVGQLQPGVLYEVYEDHTDDMDGKCKDDKDRKIEPVDPFISHEEDLFSIKTQRVLHTQGEVFLTSQYQGLPPELPPEL